MASITSCEESSAAMTSLTPAGRGKKAPFGKETLLNKQYIKQGHVICGICCDARRAVIILDTFSIIMMGIISALLYYYNNDIAEFIEEKELIENEDLRNDLEVLIVEYGWLLVAFFGVYTFFALLAIAGALSYNKDMVVATAFWNCFLGAVSLFSFSIFCMLVFVAGFFAYPHFVLFQEIGEGIMSQENYPNEMHSCCCMYSEKPRLSIREAIEKRVGVFA